MKTILSLCLLLLLMPNMHAQQLVGYEYFYNEDPGVGQATYVAITPAATFDANINLNTTGLPTGLQNVGIRFKDSDNNWSTVQSQFFVNFPMGNGKTNQIKTMEVFFDEDPGIGAGILVPITPTDHLNQTVNVPIPNTMTSGSKVTYVRVQNTAGFWSQYQSGTTELTLSIKEYKNLQSQGITFYPNPATHYFNIQIDNKLEGKIEVLITDISGKIVMQESIQKNEQQHKQTVDVSRLSAGHYSINFVHQQNKNIGVAKLVIYK